MFRKAQANESEKQNVRFEGQTSTKSRRATLGQPHSRKDSSGCSEIFVWIVGVNQKNTKEDNEASEENLKRVLCYNLEVTNEFGSTWLLEKTFQDFYHLHKQMESRCPGATKMIDSFPTNEVHNPSIDSPEIEYRKKFFEGYLQALLEMSPRLHGVNDFLEIHNHGAKAKKRELCIDDFELLKVLGKGSFAKVFLVRNSATEEIYAMKVLNKKKVKQRRQIEHTKTEMRVLREAAHPFIVSLRFAFTSDERLFMVSEFCRGGDLGFHLRQMMFFTPDMVRFYSAEIALALDYLHERDIIYRDMKPHNVLLDRDGHIKLADFGLSRENVTDSRGATTFCGTPEYVSPEMLLGHENGSGYGKSVDWWGLGVLIHEMFYGLPAFYDRNRKRMWKKIKENQLVFYPRLNEIPDEAKAMISDFLEKDPEERLGINGNGFADVKAHRFLSTIDFDLLYQKKLDPPFKPTIADPTLNFDERFTQLNPEFSERVKSSSDDEGEEDVFHDFKFHRESYNTVDFLV